MIIQDTELNMSITLYHYPISAPSRTALLTARALNLDVDLQILDLMKKEHFREEFMAINPQHCVPTMRENDFILWESQAIACYLASKYSKDDCFYPRNIKKRAIVDSLIHFGAGTLFQEVRFKGMPFILSGKNQDLIPDEIQTFHKAFAYLNTILNEKLFLTGEKYSVADIVLITTVSSITEAGLDLIKYPNIQKWLNKCAETIPGYEENQRGVEELAKMLLKHKK